METDKALKEMEELIAEAEDKLKDLHIKFQEDSLFLCPGRDPQRNVLPCILAATQAQQCEMKALETEGIPNSKALHLAMWVECLENQNKGLKETLVSLQYRNNELLRKKERVKDETLEEQLLTKLYSPNSNLLKQSEDVSLSNNQAINNLRQKIKKARLLQDLRILQLNKFLNSTYPQVDEHEMDDGLEKDIFDLGRERADKCFLADFVEVLLNGSVMKPNDPWVEIGDMWPPYIELLLRTGIAERNPENHHFIKLVV